MRSPGYVARMAKDAVRRSDGFLERGEKVTRLEAFVDAAFAFAVTVLVLKVFQGMEGPVRILNPGALGPDARRSPIPAPDSVQVVRDAPEFSSLMESLSGVPGFIASFMMIAMFWWAHQTWSRRYGLDDGRSIFLSLTLVALVGVFVFPLHFMFQCAFGWFSTLVLPQDMHLPFAVRLESVDDLRTMYLVYGSAWSTLGAVIVGLYYNAWHHRRALGLNLEERVMTQAEMARWMLVPATGTLSCILAVTLPFDAYWMAGVPGMVYSLMGLTRLVIARRRASILPLVEAELEEEAAQGAAA